MNTAAATSPSMKSLGNDLSAIRPANAAFLAQPRKLLIDGAWVAAASGKTFEVRDPSSDAVIGHCALGDAPDVERAVAAARRAFDEGDWARMTPVDRERLLHRLADLIEQHADDLAELEAIDNGKSVLMARHVDIKHALEVWRYMAGWPTKIEGKTLPLSGTLCRASNTPPSRRASPSAWSVQSLPGTFPSCWPPGNAPPRWPRVARWY